MDVEIDKDRVAQTVTASLLGSRSPADCDGQGGERLHGSLRTGRGLELGDLCRRAVGLYGEPESRSPSVRGANKLELLFYSFDWAGDNVPQSMEVSCDATRHRVVEITLAFPTL